MRISKKTKKLITQAVEYMIAGGAWFWSGYIIISVLDDPFMARWGESKGLFIANFIGNAVGISINFVLNKYWVFKTKKQSDLLNTTWRYIVYTALNAFLLNYLILQGLLKVGIQPEIGQFIAAGFFTVWNFIWYKLWVFKGQDKPKKRIKHHA